MALSASTVWEIRQAGADTNGGGYVSGGTDWSQQNAAQYALSNGQTQGTAVILLPAASSDMVGNIAYVAGGTGSVAANWYQILSVSAGVSITVDRSTGLTAGTGVTVNIGGALGTLGVLSTATAALGGQLVNGMLVWVKYSATAMSCSTSTTGPGGPMVLPAIPLKVQGYDVSRGDNTGNKPAYKWTAGAPGGLTYLATLNVSASQILANVVVDGNTVNNVGGVSGAGRGVSYNCIAQNCSGTSGIGFSAGNAYGCRASSCVTGFSGMTGAAYCDATGGTTGYAASSSGSTVHCLARAMTTGFAVSGPNLVKNCTADACTTSGFNVSYQASLSDCLATNCTGSGVGYTVSAQCAMMSNCAYYNNNTNISGTPVSNLGPIAVTADPYVAHGSNDFRLNTANPGGGQLRNMGTGVFGQTDNADIGAVQHTDPAGGGAVVISPFTGINTLLTM